MKSDVSFTLRLPFSLKQELFQLAEKKDETAAAVAIIALTNYMKKENK